MKWLAIRGTLFAVTLLVWSGQAGFAQTTNIWANSNVNDIPTTNDWFTGGPNTQGIWTGGTPVGSSLNTIQFFQDSTTPVTNTVSITKRIHLNNGGSAFQIGTLTLTGRASSSANVVLNMNLTGDALNFSGSSGTMNFSSVAVGANGRYLHYNVNNVIRLGTGSSASTLTIGGNGDSTYNMTGSMTELQIGGGSKLVKSGTSIVTISGNVTFSGGLEVNAGTLRLTGSTNIITGGIVLNGGTFGDNSGPVSTATLNNNPITVNGWVSMGLQGGATTGGGVTLNSGTLSTGSNTGSVTFNGPVTGSGGFRLIQLGMGGSTANLNSSSNTFTGPLEINCAGYDGTLNFKSLGDSAGAGNIRFIASGSQYKIINYTGDAPLTLNYRKIEIANTGSDYRIRNQSANALTINTDLSVTIAGTMTIQLGGTGSGISTFAGKIDDGAADSINVTKIDSGTWVLSGTNSYAGQTTVNGGILVLRGRACLPDEGTLNIVSGKVQPDDREAVAVLQFNGTNQLSGSWGAPGSGAEHIDGTRFAGIDRLYVGGFPPSGTMIILR